MMPGLSSIAVGLSSLGAPPVLSFIGSASSTSDLTTYTFSSQSIGVAAADRFVVVAVHGQSSGATSVSSVTVGGVSLTELVDIPGADNTACAIYGGIIPTGTTADIVVTFGSGRRQAGIGVYTITGLNSTTPVDTASAADASSPVTVTIDVLEDGIVIAALSAGDTTAVGWTGATETYDNSVESEARFSGAGDDEMAAETGRTVEASFGGNGTGMAVVSFR